MAMHHLYMKGKNWWGIFYRIEDTILYFTMYSVYARRLEMTVVAFSIMFNHTHSSVLNVPKPIITLFQRQIGVSYAHAYNKEYERNGQLWHHSFGSSLKISAKKMLSIIVYVFNNCVAGKMNRRAIENRWTLLAYYNNPHPFSEPIIKGKCSKRMLRAMKLVDISFKNDEPLSYAIQKRLFSGLTAGERSQIIDYLISKYNFLDYDALIALYGSFEKALIAMDSTAGTEYDMKDDTGDHSCYAKMIALTKRLFPDMKKINVEKMSPEQKNKLTKAFYANINLNPDHIRKFLHL